MKKLSQQRRKAIVSVIGKDQVGIIAKVTTVVAERKINILDISQSLMEDCFIMVVLLDFTNADKNLVELQNEFTALGEELNLKIKLQNKEIFRNIYNV